ncbi:MAG: TlpA disulfide reductase family protein [Bacteroidota bacterium]|nr:TlpA disulfide reductase family protein [Bacteroidota bacterium]
MKKLLLIALMFGFFACTQKPTYKVSVKLTGAEGKAFLSQRMKGVWVKLDSAALENGEFQFKGSVKNPEVYFLSISSKKERLPFFIENSVISITGSSDSLSKAKVAGSSVNDEYQAIEDKIGEVSKQGSEIYKQSKEAEKAGNKIKADSLMVMAETLFNSIDEQQRAIIKANPASYVSPFLLSQIYYEMEADVLEGFLSGFDPKLDSVATVISLKERVAKLKLVAIGQAAPDFTMNDVAGNPVKLSDVYSKNEYTLVDFWASWCGPCRRENPNVVAVFNSYKSKGFGVFGVSLDADKEKWVKAIADDQLTWPHVSDLKGWQNEAAAMYSVNSIPANMLVDKTGKIIGRNLRGEKLRETISELLK